MSTTLARRPSSVADQVRAMLRNRRADHALEGAFYIDPDLYELDLEAIFYREWIFAAATCELPEPGNFVTFMIGRSPILVVRDRAGSIQGFFNTCRHRGFKLCDTPSGRMPAIVCPYHRWTYRLDGSLAAAKHMGDDFDPKEHGLRAVHTRVVGGTVYVCLAEQPPDFAPYAGNIGGQLAPHGLETAKLAASIDLVEHGNWKMVMENSRECYHCATGHKELMRTFLDIYDWSNPEEAADIRAYWSKWEDAGFGPSITEGPHYRGARLPLTGESQSMTMDGELACTRPLGAGPEGAYGSLRWVHYPSTFNHALSDFAVLVRMLPVGPEETLVTTKFLVAPDAVEGVDYDLARLVEVWNATNDQDKALVERNQQGVRSVGYQPGPYSPSLEAGVIKFVDWYCERLDAHLTEADAA